MAKRKLFDKLNQYNANDVKDYDKQEEYNEILGDFNKFNSLAPSQMQNLIDGVKDNASAGWITSVEFKHKEIDGLATEAMEEHKKDYETIKPQKPPRPKVNKDNTQALPETQESNNATQAPPKPPKPPKPVVDSAQQVSENNSKENPKQTSRFKFPELKLPKLKLPKIRLSTSKTDSTPPATEEHKNKKDTPVKTQNLKQISNNMRERLNYITEKAGNAFNSTFSSKKRESSKGMKK